MKLKHCEYSCNVITAKKCHTDIGVVDKCIRQSTH